GHPGHGTVQALPARRRAGCTHREANAAKPWGGSYGVASDEAKPLLRPLRPPRRPPLVLGRATASGGGQRSRRGAGGEFFRRLPKVAACVLFAGQPRRSRLSLFPGMRADSKRRSRDPAHRHIGEAMTSPKRTPQELLSSWVVARSSAAAADWFLGQIERLKSSPTEKDIYLALGYTTRKLGKSDLELKAEERAAAAAARPYWDPSDWSVDQAARIVFVLAGQTRDSKAFKTRLETLFNTADVGEPLP